MKGGIMEHPVSVLSVIQEKKIGGRKLRSLNKLVVPDICSLKIKSNEISTQTP